MSKSSSTSRNQTRNRQQAEFPTATRPNRPDHRNPPSAGPIRTENNSPLPKGPSQGSERSRPSPKPPAKSNFKQKPVAIYIHEELDADDQAFLEQIYADYWSL